MRRIAAFLLTAVLLPLAGCAADSIPAHESFEIASTKMEEARPINVYLPPGYASGESRYDVLYMLDGGINEDFPHIANTVDAAIRAGAIKPILVVGIANTVRRRDMTPPTEVASDREVAPVVGHAARFRDFIGDELIPEIERRYRTGPRRAIIGESLAGLFILDTWTHRPELFDLWIAFSPSLWWNDQALVRGAEARIRQDPGAVETLHFAVANETDIVKATDALATHLRNHAPAGLSWTYEPHPELRHDTIYRALAPGAIRRWFAVDPAPAP